MSQPSVNQASPPDAVTEVQVTPPMFIDESEVWFSAYGFSWGYAAYSLPAQTVRAQMGAANGSVKQMTLAFELGKRRIREAVHTSDRPHAGERKPLPDVPS